jgi:hypothetical protein
MLKPNPKNPKKFGSIILMELKLLFTKALVITRLFCPQKGAAQWLIGGLLEAQDDAMRWALQVISLLVKMAMIGSVIRIMIKQCC